MPNVPFKFAIVNASLQYYKVAGINVSLSATPIYLNKSVVDWATLTLNYKRDSTYLGVIRSYSPQKVRFANDAASILRYIKNTQGNSEAIAYLGVYLWDSTKQVYTLLDYWQFDFSQASNSQFYFECALMDGGLTALLKANGSANYNVPLNDPALAPNYPVYNTLPADQINLLPPINPATIANTPTPKYFYIDGIPILGQFQFSTNTLGEMFSVWADQADIFTVGLSEATSFGDFNGSLGTANSPLQQQKPGPGGNAISQTVLFTSALQVNGIVSSPCTMNIAYNLQFYYFNNSAGSANSPVKLQFCYKIYDAVNPAVPDAWVGTADKVVVWQDDNWLPQEQKRTISIVGKTASFTLLPGQMLVVGFSYITENGENVTETSGVGIVFQPYDITNIYPLPAITLNGSFVPPSSVCRAISHNDLFNYLRFMMATNGGLLTDAAGNPVQPYASKSTLLSTPRIPSAVGNYDLNPTDTWFTCSDSLRGLDSVTIQDPEYNDGIPFTCYIVPAIYTNMQDFAADLLADLCASIGIEKTGIGTDTLVAEELSYFFDDSKIIADLGDDIANFSMDDLNDYKGSTVSVGQTDQQFDSLNGPFEVNSEVNWILPIIRIQKALNLKTPYRCEALGIEETRGGIGNKTNVNSSSDNDTFKLQADGTGTHSLQSLANANGVSGYLNIEQALNGDLPPIVDVLVTPTVTANTIYNQFFSSNFISQIVRTVSGITTTYYWGVSFNQEVNSITGLPTGNITGITTGALPLTFLAGQSLTISGVPTDVISALVLQRPKTDATGVSNGLPDNLLTPAVNPYGWYNLAFSPQRKALRLAPWFCSNFYGLLGKLMAISGYKKNIKLVSDLGAGPVTELNWLNLSDTAAQTYTPPYSLAPITIPAQPIPAGKTTIKLFLPYVFSFTSKVPVNLPQAMTPPGTVGAGMGLMYGKIKFTFVRNGISYPLAGFVLEAGITPGTNNTYNYRLLCSPTVTIPNTL